MKQQKSVIMTTEEITLLLLSTSLLSKRSSPFGHTMSGIDKRKVVGEKIHAKATSVTNLLECSCRYGSQVKTKEVVGTIVAINYVPMCNQNNSRTNCMITADFDLGGGTVKRLELNIQRVKAGRPLPPTATAITALTATPALPEQPTTLAVPPGKAAAPPAVVTPSTILPVPPAPPENALQAPAVLVPVAALAPAVAPHQQQCQVLHNAQPHHMDLIGSSMNL